MGNLNKRSKAFAQHAIAPLIVFFRGVSGNNDGSNNALFAETRTVTLIHISFYFIREIVIHDTYCRPTRSRSRSESRLTFFMWCAAYKYGRTTSKQPPACMMKRMDQFVTVVQLFTIWFTEIHDQSYIRCKRRPSVSSYVLIVFNSYEYTVVVRHSLTLHLLHTQEDFLHSHTNNWGVQHFFYTVQVYRYSYVHREQLCMVWVSLQW